MEARDIVKRKIIVYIATSADGFIARKNGDIDWLDRPRVAGDYGMADFYRSIDTILWGRKTYDVVLKMQKDGVKGATFDPHVKNYLFSRRRRSRLVKHVELVKESVPRFAKRLRAEPGRHIWMMGGGELIASFLDAGEIDEFMVHVIPTMIGEGIPLVAPRRRLVPLTLRRSKHYADGVVSLHYDVVKAPARGPTRRA
jgi:dihydrofolate reductase